MRPLNIQIRLRIRLTKGTGCHKSPSKTQISLHIPIAKFTIWPYAPIEDSDQTAHRCDDRTLKVTSWPYVPIEDSVQTANLRTKSYKITVCAHRRLRSDWTSRTKSFELTVCIYRRVRSVCTSSKQKLLVDRMRPSKTQFSLHMFLSFFCLSFHLYWFAHTWALHQGVRIWKFW